MSADAERRTSDPIDPATLQKDGGRVLDALADGGVAVVALDVAYGILGARPDAIRKIFDAKNRSYEKPSGMFSNWKLSSELHIMEDRLHTIVREMCETGGLPFSVVAPFREDHPLIKAVDPFVMSSSSKVGTLDMLLNAGQLHDELARQSAERGMLVFGSSANTSLTGSKYRVEDIDKPVLDAADIVIDYGTSKFENDLGRSSTIIDFRDFTVIRIGVEFDDLAGLFKSRYDIDLIITDKTAGKA
ncbi:MAG: Sua5/YciO/YrdC/YwlC family protein [Pseudomonadota bacterium]